MNTHANRVLLMSASSFVLGVFGIAATFLPQEILSLAGAAPSGLAPILVQLTGALYLSFAMMNWMGRLNLIGGIYSRPVATGNMLHFVMGALALIKHATSQAPASPPLLIILGVYAIFAACFALLLFTHPTPDPASLIVSSATLPPH